MTIKPFAIQATDLNWSFGPNGHITFPDGSVQVTAYTGQDGGDANVWVQDFETSLGSPDDVPGSSTGVEYLANGDIVALFNHYCNPAPGNNESRYNSVARFDSTGTKLWSVAFAGNQYTDGWGMAVDNVNDFIYVAGRENSESNDYARATLTKLSQLDGSVVWSKVYDIGYENTNVVVDVASDGSPIVVGYASNGDDNQIVTTKINASSGAVTWSKALNGQGDEEAYGMAVGPNNEVVAVGFMDQLGLTDVAATVYSDPLSNPLWTIGGTGLNIGGVITLDVSFTNGVPTFTNIVDLVGGRTVDGTIATIGGAQFGGVTGVDDMVLKVGTLAANEPDDRMLIVKYDSTGTIEWQKAVQVDAGFNCFGADADIDSEGNIYVCGNYNYDGQSPWLRAMIIIKFNSSGVKQYSRKVVGDCEDVATSIVVGPDDCLYLTGITGTENNDDYTLVLAKYNLDGTVAWQRLLDNTTTWTFAGNLWFSESGGGSNLAVRNGYVAVAGGFGDPFDTVPHAIVAQFNSDGTVFAVGNYDFKAATFSGLLNGSASNITVVDADKTDSNFFGAFDTYDFDPDIDLTADLIGILYGDGGGSNKLVNGTNEVILESDGSVVLPAGGTITEGIVTSNPTIQLTPASPDVASQKLVIKGGGQYNYTDNGISLNYDANTAIVGDTLYFYVYSETYSGQTLYWWIYPTDAGIGDSNSGTVTLSGSSGDFSILIDNDDYEFTIRVSPEADNYDPANVGVESGLINADEPAFDSPHHLHLTTGDLTETSIFLGTDNHNVRTTVDGKIQITTPDEGTTNVWEFDTDGYLTLPYPGGSKIKGGPENGINSIDLSWELILASGKTIKINPGGGGVVSSTLFRFDSDASGGGITLPAGSSFDDKLTGVLIAGAGRADVNRFYARVSNTLYEAVDAGITYQLINQAGTWSLDVVGANNPQYTSADLITWTNAGGGLPAPTGELTTRETTLTVGTNNTWAFGGDGELSLPTNGYSEAVIKELDATALVLFAQSAGGNIKLLAGATLAGQAKQWLFNGTDGGLTFPDATVQTTAYPGRTTVAKTGIAYNTGTATALADSTYSNPIVDGSYGPFTRGAVTFTVVVTGGVAAYTVTATSGNTAVGAVIGTLDTGDLGGTSGSTSNIEVTDVVQAATAIDLTKTVNKLTNGYYTLADGVEGQIMYLVPQNGVSPEDVAVSVAHSRIAGIAYTPAMLAPFRVYEYSGDEYYNSTGMCTLIFTDGAWQQQGGAWTN